ncbi:MAG: mechanosensitive ion channel family protein [Patescibacteria group bacterium]
MKISRNKKVISSFFLFILVIIVVMLSFSRLLLYLKFPATLHDIVLASVVFLIGYFMINFIDKKIIKSIEKYSKRKQANILSFIFLIVSYLVLIIIVLDILNINITNILVGGAFLGVILAVASQSMLSNLFGGIIILLFRQFDPGDKIKITTWQFSFLLPAYPNKFFSKDLVLPGYVGMVDSTGFFYTNFIGEDGIPFKIPNSILIQASILKLDDIKYLNVQIKYEIKKELSFKKARDIIKDIIEKTKTDHGFEVKNFDIYIDETSLTTYVVVIKINIQHVESEFSIKSTVLEMLIDKIDSSYS